MITWSRSPCQYICTVWYLVTPSRGWGYLLKQLALKALTHPVSYHLAIGTIVKLHYYWLLIYLTAWVGSFWRGGTGFLSLCSVPRTRKCSLFALSMNAQKPVRFGVTGQSLGSELEWLGWGPCSFFCCLDHLGQVTQLL